MTVRIKSQARVKSQTLVNFPPAPALNLNFTKGYADGLNPLPSTVTFTRADASAIATQVGPDGLLRLAAHNLLTYSQQFDNAAWTKINAGVTADGAVAPDGTTSMDLVYNNTAGSAWARLRQVATTVGGATYTASFYVKDSNSGFAVVALYDVGVPSTLYCYINLASGALVVDAGMTATAQQVGSGVWRISVTRPLSASTTTFQVNVGPAASLSNFNVAVNAGVYVWGAQLERNITPSYYVPTTSAAVYANTPRFDYDPVTTEPKGLLIEEARTNLFAYSNTLNNAAWVVGGGAFTAPSMAAPDGSATSYLFTEDTTTGPHRFYYTTTFTAGQTTLSFYAKPNGRTFLYFYADSGFSTGYLNLTTGAYTVSTGSALPTTITNVGNGWYRYSITWNQTTTVSQTIQLWLATSSSANTYTGNGTSGVYFFGMQMELGSFATSYIPTTSASVTRAAESAAMTGTNFSSWYNATNGTFNAAFDTFAQNNASSNATLINVSDGTLANYARINTSPSYGIRSFVVTGSSTQVNATKGSAPTDNVTYRIANALAASNFAITLSGLSPATTASGTMPTVNQLTIGNWFGSSNTYLNGHLAYLQYWPARFTDAQLQLITKAAPTLTVQGATTLVGSTTVR